MRRILGLSAGIAALAASAAPVSAEPAGAPTGSVDAYGVEQPAIGITGVGIDDAAPAQVTREGGYIPPHELQARERAGTVAPDVRYRPAAGPGAIPADDARDMRVRERDRMTVLGVTVGQLRGADLVDPRGRELGEVEEVLADVTGEPVSVIVELEDDIFGDDRWVEITLAELQARPEDPGDIWDDDIELVTDRPLSWFEQAPDWRFSARDGRWSGVR